MEITLQSKSLFCLYNELFRLSKDIIKTSALLLPKNGFSKTTILPFRVRIICDYEKEVSKPDVLVAVMVCSDTYVKRDDLPFSYRFNLL
jgi:hypothetical protein